MRSINTDQFASSKNASVRQIAIGATISVMASALIAYAIISLHRERETAIYSGQGQLPSNGAIVIKPKTAGDQSQMVSTQFSFTLPTTPNGLNK